jgi:glycosyltransferase involved in cell wall biosynthesis
MKIGIDIRTAGGEKTGKGWFTFHMTQNLLKLDKKNEYILYAKDGVAGFEQFKNAKQKLINGGSIFWHKNVANNAKKEGVEVFFAPSSYITPFFLPKSIKTILTVHDLVAFLFPEGNDKKATFIEKMFLRKAIKKATKIIAVSKNTKKDLEEKFNDAKGKIEVVYCSSGEEFKPVSKESLQEFIKKTSLPKKFFLSVGTLNPRKNYPTLIKAFAKLNEKYPNYNLIIVGGKGLSYEEIKSLIKENYLNKKVHLLGYLSTKSMIGLYNLAEAFVFPSFYEGFGIPPLEAMRCGCPVISSYTSAMPEVVSDAALMINPDNVDEIFGAMIKIIEDEDLKENLMNKGLIRSKKFSWKDSGAKLLEIISGLE